MELLIRRRLVWEFIMADYADVAFRRTVKTKTDAGGYREDEQPALPAQRIRLIPQKRRFASTFVNTEAGEIEKWPYNFIGKHNLNVKEEDRFSYRGNEYQVMAIEPDREERTLLSCDYFGDREALL
ncbi:MAG: hypothetical protein LC650_04205 [Actinobacteria bacterium]|nr:hypothetical protein [Actinomycetota bacterium]